MRIEPGREDWALAGEVYDLFRRKPGAEHIASRFALAHLSSILSMQKPCRVLEMGAGIGTITYLLCHHPCSPERIVSTEENDFCLQQLETNIPQSCLKRIELITNPVDISLLKEKFDMIIFDSQHDDIDITNILGEGTVCFVEGSRKPTREAIQRMLENIGMRCEFTNHAQGKKAFHVSTKKWNILGLSIPKVRFFKNIKGCWIGVVERV